MPPVEQLQPPRVQLAVEPLDERDRLVGEDLLFGRDDAHAAVSSLELRLLRRPLQRERRAVRRHGLRDEVEVAGADLALVPRRGVAELLHRELVLLELHVRRHLVGRVAACELEHARVERVEAGERDELEAVAHLAEHLLEAGDLLRRRDACSS